MVRRECRIEIGERVGRTWLLQLGVWFSMRSRGVLVRNTKFPGSNYVDE